MELTSASLVELIERVTESLREPLEEAGVRIDVQSDGDLEVVADETQLEVALRCLCQNSIEAMPAGGTLAIRCGNRQVDEVSLPSEFPRSNPLDCAGEFVVVSIADDGPGLSDQVRQHMFDPFFRRARGGARFGVRLVQGLENYHRTGRSHCRHKSTQRWQSVRRAVSAISPRGRELCIIHHRRL